MDPRWLQSEDNNLQIVRHKRADLKDTPSIVKLANLSPALIDAALVADYMPLMKSFDSLFDCGFPVTNSIVRTPLGVS